MSLEADVNAVACMHIGMKMEDLGRVTTALIAVREWRKTVINIGLIFCVLGGFFLSIVIFCLGVWAGTITGVDGIYENLDSMDDAEIVMVVREAAKRRRGLKYGR